MDIEAIDDIPSVLDARMIFGLGIMRRRACFQ
jgi:hypothetical protein